MPVVYRAGDIVLCHSKGIIGKAIRFAERHDGEGSSSKWNHVAVLNTRVDGKWLVIQAEAKGVTNDKFLDSIAPGGEYEIIPLPDKVDRAEFLDFCRSQVGSKYGFLTIISCALDMYLPDAICLRKAGTWICSGLVAGGLWFSGYKNAYMWPDLYTVTPAQIASSLTSV